MRVIGLSLAVLLLAPLSARAARDDVWIIGIHHIDNQGDKPFTAYAGAGYSGVRSSGDAQFVGKSYGYNNLGTPVGVNRVYWELSGNAIVGGQATGATPPTSSELYRIDFFGTPDGGHNSWQPVESQFHGVAGETYPEEPSIPWYLESGTNHQYMAANGSDTANWFPIGPGPHSPSGTAYNASGNGSYMWLKAGSWLYAKWDFSFGVDRSWTALRLTQVTPLPGAPVTGDYNKNGTVDAADYLVWRSTYGSVGSNLPADGFPDGFIDEYDYDVWRERFGRTSGSGAGTSESTAVPEPATFTFTLMAMTAAVICFALRRGSRLAIRHDLVAGADVCDY